MNAPEFAGRLATGRRGILLLAAGLTCIDLVLGAYIRWRLAPRAPAGWIVQSLVFCGRSEHLTGHFSGAVVVVIVSVPIVMWQGAAIVRLLPPVAVVGFAVMTAGGVANAIEAGVRGAVTNYLVFYHGPLAGNDAYNLADVEVYIGGGVGIVRLLPFVLRRARRAETPAGHTGSTSDP